MLNIWYLIYAVGYPKLNIIFLLFQINLFSKNKVLKACYVCFLKLIFKRKVWSMIIKSDIHEHLMKAKKLSKITILKLLKKTVQQ